MKNNPLWQKVKLSDIADINKAIMGKDYQHNEIKYIDISSVGAGELNNITSYQTEKAPGRAKRLVQDGDIIMSTVRPNRRLFLRINNPSPNLVVSTGFAVISPKKKIDGRFLYYLLTRDSFINYLSSNVKGSAYPAVGTDVFENAELTIPIDYNEQSRIASILSAFDDKIELNNKSNATLEKMAQVIFKEWFVKFRFPGYEKAKFVESELGKIPKGWEVKSWQDYEGESMSGDWGGDSNSREVPNKAYVLRGTDIPELKNGGKGECPIRFFSNESLERRQLRSGDIVIEISGGSKGQPTGRAIFITESLVKRFELPLVPTSFCRLVRGNGMLEPILMYLHLDRLYKTKKIWNYQLQSTGISNFQYGQFKQYERLLQPQRHAQLEISKFLHNCIAYGQRNENLVLESLRDLLLPKLMKGEIKI